MELALQIVIGLVVAGVGGAIVSWRGLERFKAYYEGREEGRIEWRREVEKRLDSHAADLKAVANHEYRIAKLEVESDRYRNAWHDFRDKTIKEIQAIHEKWRDEMIERFEE